MGIWGWVQWIATGWFALSILLAVAWAMGGRKIFRKPPAPPRLVDDRKVRRIHDGENGDALYLMDGDL
jgi:hypothetical protein